MPAELEIEKYLQAWLRTRPAVIALIGQRLYPNAGPQNVIYPYATYRRISGGRWHDLKAVMNVMRARVQIDCYGKTPLSANVLAATMSDEIDTFRRGLMNGVFVQSVHVEDIRDDSKRPIDATERMEYKMSFDVMIVWETTLGA